MDHQRRNREFSYQGALIAVPSAIPPVDSAVTLVFHYECQVLLTAKVDSQVVHTSEEAVDAGGVGGFGLAFNGPVDEVLPKLQPPHREVECGLPVAELTFSIVTFGFT